MALLVCDSFLGLVCSQVSRSYYLFYNYMSFYYMSVLVFQRIKQPCVLVFQRKNYSPSIGVSAWKTHPGSQLSVDETSVDHPWEALQERFAAARTTLEPFRGCLQVHLKGGEGYSTSGSCCAGAMAGLEGERISTPLAVA